MDSSTRVPHPSLPLSWLPLRPFRAMASDSPALAGLHSAFFDSLHDNIFTPPVAIGHQECLYLGVPHTLIGDYAESWHSYLHLVLMGGDDVFYISSLDTHCRDEVALQNGNNYLSRAEFEMKIKEAITLPVEETEEGVGYRSQVASFESNRQLGVDPHNKFGDLLVRSTFNILQWPFILVGEDENSGS